MLPHRQQTAFEAAPHWSHQSRDSWIVFPSCPFPSAGAVVRLRLLHCARVATTVGPASDTSSEGTISDALDALQDQLLLDEAVEMYAELDDELRLELELEPELELLHPNISALHHSLTPRWVRRFLFGASRACEQLGALGDSSHPRSSA